MLKQIYLRALLAIVVFCVLAALAYLVGII